MKLITKDARLERSLLDHVLVLEFRVGRFVGVVGNILFLLAHKLPVVALERSVETPVSVSDVHPLIAVRRAVEGNVGSPPGTALGIAVEPRLASPRAVVDWLMQQVKVAEQIRWSVKGAVKGEQVIGLPLVEILVLHKILADADAVELAVSRHRCPIGTSVIGPEPPQLVVQNFLGTRFWNRERRTRQLVVPQTVVFTGCLGGDGLGGVVHELRIGEGSMAWINRHGEVRISFQHCKLASRQFVCVLFCILGSDDEKRLFIRERIDIAHFRLPARRWLGHATLPRWDCSVLVAGFFCTIGCQILAKPICLGLGQRRIRRQSR